MDYTSKPTEAQRALDELQVRLLGSQPTKRQVAEYANACINSALGPVRAIGGDLAALGVLIQWLDTVTGRLGPGGDAHG